MSNKKAKHLRREERVTRGTCAYDEAREALNLRLQQMGEQRAASEKLRRDHLEEWERKFRPASAALRALLAVAGTLSVNHVPE